MLQRSWPCKYNRRSRIATIRDMFVGKILRVKKCNGEVYYLLCTKNGNLVGVTQLSQAFPIPLPKKIIAFYLLEILQM